MKYKIGTASINIIHVEDEIITTFFYSYMLLPSVNFYRNKIGSHTKIRIKKVGYYEI